MTRQRLNKETLGEEESSSDLQGETSRTDDETVTEIRVGGIQLDLGSMTALSTTLSTCALTTIRLWHAGLDRATLQLLASSLEDSTVQRLYLDFNELPMDDLGNDGTSLFAPLVADQPTLQFLSLRGNAIHDEEAIAIFKALEENKSLMSLSLWNNNITVGSMEALSHTLLINKTLTHLNLASNNLRDSGVRSLMSCFNTEVIDKEEVKRLKTEKIPTSAVKGFNFRDPNQTLKLLNLCHNGVGDEGCLEVLYTLNPLVRPLPDEPEEADDGKKGGKKGAKKGADRPDRKDLKASRLEKVVITRNHFSSEVHQQLHEEEKFEVEPYVQTDGGVVAAEGEAVAEEEPSIDRNENGMTEAVPANAPESEAENEN